MSKSAPLVTAEELERFPDDDYRYELVEGRVIKMSPVGYEHGRIVMRLAALLHRYVEEHHLGAMVSEVGFKLASSPDTVRAPDLAFVRLDRIPRPDPRGFIKGAPDLAVEVLSPDDRLSDVRAKTVEYLASGAPLVLILDPFERTITAHRQVGRPQISRAGDVVDLGDVVPGFSCTIPEIFG
ncbi:MAG TPA: Uma2 family endonuclease [Vicinamibacterales bacterium]|nr:Uma2 family endonuclease [Vicinamibacterales bacterium]